MVSTCLSLLLLLTIVAAFAGGIALGRWVIFGVLNFFDPAPVQNKPAPAGALAPTTVSD